MAKFIYYSSENYRRVYNGETDNVVVFWRNNVFGSVPRDIVAKVSTVLIDKELVAEDCKLESSPRFEIIYYKAGEYDDKEPVTVLHDIARSEDILSTKEVDDKTLNSVYAILCAIV